jgi:hypothetical protein
MEVICSSIDHSDLQVYEDFLQESILYIHISFKSCVSLIKFFVNKIYFIVSVIVNKIRESRNQQF